MIGSVLVTTVSGLIKSFTTSYIGYIVMEFLDTATGSGSYSAAFILGKQFRHKFILYKQNNNPCFATKIKDVIQKNNYKNLKRRERLSVLYCRFLHAYLFVENLFSFHNFSFELHDFSTIYEIFRKIHTPFDKSRAK